MTEYRCPSDDALEHELDMQAQREGAGGWKDE